MSIYITGGNGLICGRLAQELCDTNDVVVLSRNATNYPKNIKSIIVENYGDVNLDKHDTVIHTASPNHSKCENLSIFNSYVDDTKRLIKKSLNAQVANFIFTSSTRIYGDNLKGSIDEMTPIVIGDNYSIMKHEIEKTLLNCNSLNSCIVRISNGYGWPLTKESNCWDLLGMYIAKTITNYNEIKIKSNGRQYKDFIPISFIVQNLIDIVNYPSMYPNILNLSAGKSSTVKDFAMLIIERAKLMQSKELGLVLNKSNTDYDHFIITNSHLKFNLSKSTIYKEIDDLLSFCLKHFKN